MKKGSFVAACTAFAITLSTGIVAENAPIAMPPSGQFAWNELATTDVQAAKDFYSKLFGWEFVDKPAGDMFYTIVKKGGKEFAGIWAIPAAQKGQIPPHWLSYVLVDNLEQSLEIVRQNGGKIIKPTQQAGDAGIFAIIQDPTGAQIALWQGLKKA